MGGLLSPVLTYWQPVHPEQVPSLLQGHTETTIHTYQTIFQSHPQSSGVQDRLGFSRGQLAWETEFTDIKQERHLSFKCSSDKLQTASSRKTVRFFADFQCCCRKLQPPAHTRTASVTLTFLRRHSYVVWTQSCLGNNMLSNNMFWQQLSAFTELPEGAAVLQQHNTNLQELDRITHHLQAVNYFA